MEDILVPLGFFAMIAAIVVVPLYLRARERERMIEAVRVGYERGQPVPPDLIAAMHAPRRSSPERDFRAGVILIAVALAFVIFGAGISQVAREDEVAWVFTGMAAFPGLIGLAFIAFWLGKRGSPSDGGV